DYMALPTSVVIPANAASITVTLTPLDDLLFEGNETVNLAIAPSTGYAIATAAQVATVTIIDDESTVSIVATDAIASENGAPADTGTYTITRSLAIPTALTVSLRAPTG